MDFAQLESLYGQVRPLVERAITTLLNEPAHLIVEMVLLVFVLVLLCRRSYRIPKTTNVAPLTAAVRIAIGDLHPLVTDRVNGTGVLGLPWLPCSSPHLRHTATI